MKLTGRPPSGIRRDVIVVDDEPDELARVVACEDGVGAIARPISASDAALARLAAAPVPPLAIVTDIRLVGCRFDGVELVHYARLRLGRIPAFLVSGSPHTRTSSLALLPEIGSGVMVRLRVDVGPEQIRWFVEHALTVRELDSPHAFVWADRIHALARRHDLSEPERMIATFAVAGLPNAEIEARLGRGPEAVKWWIKRLLKKTDHESLDELAHAITGLPRDERPDHYP
jgi:DNA-binding NarL/FixJ family response regulator